MISLFKILTISALITSCMLAKNGLTVVESYTDATYSCFAQQTATYVSVEAYK